jgi:hypothetical protein
MHYGTNCLLKGDFDARAEFSLVTWPAEDGLALSLGAYWPPPPENWLAIERSGGHSDGAPEDYDSNVAYRASTTTGDTSGALRLRRSKGVLTSYYRSHMKWAKLATRAAGGPVSIILMLSTNESFFGHQAATVAVDNFTATSDDVACRGAPIPPRKHRR